MSDDSEDVFAGCTPPKVKNVRMDKNIEKYQRRSCEVPFLKHEWLGIPLENLKIFNLKNVYPPVKPSDVHTVLFKIPVVPNQTIDPYPENLLDVWDKDHVRLPCSSHCLSPISKTELRNRWDLIKEAFAGPIKSSQELEAAILYYNSKYADRWNFKSLHYFFSKTLREEETEYFFSNVLPGLVKLALSLPQVITGGIPLLRQKQTHSLSLTQKQIACLLANAFLCTFPRRNTSKSSSEYKNYPDVNFNRLYSFEYGQNVQEKLKCLINYFRRVCVNCPAGVVTYSRHYVSSNKLPIWSESNSLMPQVHITSIGSIEDEGTGMMELDFANKFIGGGVLGRGCVQEEIRFVICPELIIARLFTECLDDTEALIVTGVERYNRYKGYGDNFTWAGDFRDPTPIDRYGRRLCVLVAVDAFHFQDAEKQYTPNSINRELNKAYAGFSWGTQNFKQQRMSVATGNWGCGAFGGNAYLKALLQLMVAGQTGRNVAYFTFGDPELRDKLGNMHKFLTKNKVTIGCLWKLLNKYHGNGSDKIDLYDYIYHFATKSSDACKSVPKVSYSNKEVERKQNNTEVNSPSSSAGLSSEEIEATLVCLEVESNHSNTETNKSTTSNSDKYISEFNSSKSEPMEAKSYCVKSKEGRDKCLQKQNDSWARIEESKKDFNEFQITDDDDDGDSVSKEVENSKTDVSLNDSGKFMQSPVVKRKISDYFLTTPKV